MQSSQKPFCSVNRKKIKQRGRLPLLVGCHPVKGDISKHRENDSLCILRENQKHNTNRVSLSGEQGSLVHENDQRSLALLSP